ncbi:MAG: alpha-E domain-containing protein [Polyangiaceae bacterium]
MLSRVAESVYWMNRYIERAENAARVIDVSFQLMLDGGEELAQWSPLVATSGSEALFKQQYGDAFSRENVIQFLAFDEKNPNSILSCFSYARENARSVREIVSSEMWEQINKAYLMVHDVSENASRHEAPHEFFAAIKLAAHTFVGTTYLTMTHNEAWHFGRLGRLLERADNTSRLVDAKYYFLLPTVADVGTTYDELHWVALLRSASAFEMYRKRHGRIVPDLVVDFLLREPQFPRSVRYAVIKAARSLGAIVRDGMEDTEAVRLLGKLRADLEFDSTPEIIGKGLHEYADQLQIKLIRIGQSIQDTFFTIRAEDAS